MRFRELWELIHLPPNLVFIQDAALTLVTAAFLTCELLTMLRQFWRWNGHLIQIPVWLPSPVNASAALLFCHYVCSKWERSWQLKKRNWGQMRNILDFLLMTTSRLTAETITGGAGTWAYTMYLCSLYTINFNQFDSVSSSKRICFQQTL